MISDRLVLEPLSTATGTALEPLKLRKSDFLRLWLDDDGRKFQAKLECLNEAGEPTFYPGVTPGAREFFRRVPECKHLGHRDFALKDRYALAATDYTALVVHHAWPEDRIIFRSPEAIQDDENARVTYDFLLKRFLYQNQRATVQARFKINREIPPLHKDWIDHPERPLLDFQRVAVSMALGQQGIGLFMDRGTGKTPCVIQRICVEARSHFAATGKMFRALVVCPPQVRRNWFEEVQRFAVSHGKIVIIKGSQIKRLQQLIHSITTEEGCEYSIAIIGYDSLVASIDNFAKVQWDLIVLDESHFIKSSNTKRWTEIKRLRDASRRRMILTGTPIGNSLMDLWTQLEFLGEGLSGFQDYKAYRSFHGVWQDVDAGFQSGIQRLLAVKNIPLLQERLARLTFSVTKKEAGLNLPDKQFDVWEVQMTQEQARIYEEVAEQLAVEIEDKLSGETNQLTVENILTQLLRLAQITSGFITYDPVYEPETGTIVRPKRVQQINARNPKVEALLEMITAEDRDPLGKMIVWCHWVEDILTIHRALIERDIVHEIYYGKISQAQRDIAADRYNKDPECRVLVCNPQTAAEGLNLVGYDKDDPENSPTYTDHVVFFSQNWSAIGRGQAEDRAHRKGTRVPVRITDLMVLGTIDEEIRKRVQQKQEIALTVLEIRQILANVLNLEDEG